MKLRLLLLTLALPGVSQAASVYTNATDYTNAATAAGVTGQTSLNFENLAAGTALDDDYSALGVRFSSPLGVNISRDVFGSAPVGANAAALATTNTTAMSLSLLFDRPQTAVSLVALDVFSTLSVQAFTSGGAVETFTVNAAGEDTAGGRFRGMVFAQPVVRVVFTGTNSDGYGIDNLTFTSLDNDGDTYGPTPGLQGGDCNDNDPSVNPGATEVVDGKDQDCDGVIDNLITLYTSEPTFDTAVEGDALDLTEITFEQLAAGVEVDEAYGGLGIHFSAPSALTAQSSVFGSAPVGIRGMSVDASDPAIFTLSFDEPQTWLSFRMMDVYATVLVQAYDDGGLVYEFHLSAPGEDTAGGIFRGMSFSLPITRLKFTGDSTSDGIGLDNIEFDSTDEDGDFYGPGQGAFGGDCNDADPNTNPAAPEIDGDGKDQDCDGLIDNAVTIYTSPSLFDGDIAAAGLPACRKADFETLAEGAVVNTQYQSLGMSFTPDPGITATKDVFGTKPRGTRGAKVTAYQPSTWTWTFTEPQSFVSAYFLDDSYSITVKAYLGTTLVNTFSFVASGDDVVGGLFRGFGFSRPIDKLVFLGTTGDGIGFDDVCFDAIDDDKDGYTIAQGDCDDQNAQVNPGITEKCDGEDNNCNGTTDEGFDKDNDGFTVCAGDCNDNSTEVRPGKEESCDGVDNNCDGDVDEGFDQDEDGFSSCDSPNPDCNDNNGAIFPGAQEVCNGTDDDCDGDSDEGFDKDEDGYSTCAGEGRPVDCNDNNAGVNPGAQETPYDGIDQDCLGGDLTDVDGDTFAGGSTGEDCNDNNAAVNPDADDIAYNGIDEDCSGSDLTDVDGDTFSGGNGGSDCDDSDPNTHPGASEFDDDKDNDCDGQIDEALDTTDDDEDGFSEGTGDCDDNNPDVNPGEDEIPYNGVDDDCDGVDITDVDADGFDGGDLGDDCDDNDDAINPSAPEVPYNAVDEDCDGLATRDVDEDGFDGGEGGEDCDDLDAQAYPGAAETPYDDIDQDCDGEDKVDVDGDTFEGSQVGGPDCDDNNDAISPNADEVEDGVDNNCDGAIDEGTGATDDDGDTYSENEGDCDDQDAAIFPGAEEIPYDGVDQDCIDGDLDDVDGDGFAGGDEGPDCDDDAAAINPDQTEICGDDVDEDCDGEAALCPGTPTPGGDTPTGIPQTPTPDPVDSPTEGVETTEGVSPTEGESPTEPGSPTEVETTPTPETPEPSEPLTDAPATATPQPTDTVGGDSPTPDVGASGSGCGCSTDQDPTSSLASGLLLMVGVMVSRRRRSA